MAAFTVFSEQALRQFLNKFALGELLTYSPISAGIENSNYFITLRSAGNPAVDYVLTINESLALAEAAFFSQLLHQLGQRGLPVPEPLLTVDGQSNTVFCDKPTWLFPKLPGAHPTTVTMQQCSVIGDALAQLHAAAQDCQASRANPYDQDWTSSTLAAVSNKQQGWQDQPCPPTGTGTSACRACLPLRGPVVVCVVRDVGVGLG